MLLILLLILGDLRLFQALVNAEDNLNHLAPLKTRDNCSRGIPRRDFDAAYRRRS